VFYERCAAAVDGVLEAGKDLVDGSQKPMVRAHCRAADSRFVSIDWVAEFLVLHPQVRLDFVLNDGRADLIDEGIDVAFRGGNSGDVHPSFARSPLNISTWWRSRLRRRTRHANSLQELAGPRLLDGVQSAAAGRLVLQGPTR